MPADGVFFACLFPDQIARSELTRSFPSLAHPDGSFLVASSGDVLSRLLQRAAQLQRSLPSVPEKEYTGQVAEALAGDPVAMQTEVEAMVKRRVGQNVFRSALMDYWGGKCAVTGVAVPEVLRASHCKPWADCQSDAERLDVYNGLFLTANLDALFDKGLISFTDKGEMMISVDIDPDELIKSIHVAPSAPEWFGVLLEKIVQRYELKIPVVRSRLYDRPLY